MTDLSVLIPARNEQWLARTVQDVLANVRGDTEIIAVLDGAWANPPLPQDPRLRVVHHPRSIGQRAATNEAARLSTATYVMKLDAHCAVAEGFDVALMAEMRPDWTVIPRMYNLHVFNLRCPKCGHDKTYQGATQCEKCYNANGLEQVVVWQPRRNRRTDFARFDKDLHFQYWGAYGNRPEAQGEIADVMCCVGACWMMTRARYWELGGMDEAHGSWGQMGVEVACKSWLSGGRQVVNKRTWFAHLFRTQPGFGFPYPMSGTAQERARLYSRDLWLNNRWKPAVRPFQWILDHFAPVPDWHDMPAALLEATHA